MTNPQPSATPPGRRRTNTIILGVVGAILAVVALIVVIGVVAGGGDEVPAYTASRDNDTFTAVIESDDPDQVRAVFDDIATADDLADGGYFVYVECGGTRLGHGRFAIGNLGAAQTGLAEGASEFTAIDGAHCPS